MFGYHYQTDLGNALSDCWINQHQLRMTQSFNDSIARMSNSIYFADTTNYSILLNPMYTIFQNAWMQNTSFNFNPFFADYSNMNLFKPQMPWMPGINNNSSTVTDDKDKDNEVSEEEIENDEIEYGEKYEKLCKYIDSLLAYNETFKKLSSAEVTELKKALKADGLYEEKYNTLMEAYKRIDFEKIKHFFVKGAHLLEVTNEEDGTKSSVYDRLLETGFEYKNTDVDKAVKTFHEKALTIDKNNPSNDDLENIVRGMNDGRYDILDFISSWNTEYINSTEDGVNALDYIISQHKNLDKDTQRKDLTNKVIRPLVSALTNKARNVADNLDENSQAQIKQTIELLEISMNNSGNQIDPNLSTNFNKLYLLTRIASSQILKTDIENEFGEIDDRLIEENIYEEDIYADLKTEGFSEAEINEILNAELQTVPGENPENVGGANSPANETNAEIRATAVSIGNELYGCLYGNTNKEKSDRVINFIQSYNGEVNVLDILRGYYGKAGFSGTGDEGLIELLSDDVNGIYKSHILKFIDIILKKAKELGLSNTECYKEVERLTSEVRNGKSFGQNATQGNFFQKGWGAVSSPNDCHYDAKIDKQLEKLYQKMIEIEP